MNFGFTGVWRVTATIETDKSGIRFLDGYVDDCGKLIYYRDTI
jgi:hypothetical protein